MDFRKIASGTYLEGLAFDERRQWLWYSDVIAGGVHAVALDGTRRATLNAGRMWTGGVLLNDDGAVLSTGAGGIMWNDPGTGRSGWLLDRIDDVPINGINEMVSDGTGGLVFGTSDIENVMRGEPARSTALYRLTVDRGVIKLVDGIGFTNGLMYDAERRRLYCNDTFRCCWVFDVEADLSLHNQRVLIDKDDADGVALDAQGNVWITGFRSSYITRVAPDGALLPRIEGPGGSITQIRFGGPDLHDYFINTVPADGGDALKEGGVPAGGNSFLFQGRSAVPGLKPRPPRFQLIKS